jgi:hypothetical protein
MDIQPTIFWEGRKTNSARSRDDFIRVHDEQQNSRKEAIKSVHPTKRRSDIHRGKTAEVLHIHAYTHST